MASSLSDALAGTGLIPKVPASSLQPDPKASNSNDRLDAALSKLDKQEDALAQSADKVSEGMHERQKERSSLKSPEIPQLTEVPKTEQRDPLQAFGSAAGWLAVFGSVLARQPITSSLNAAAGVMNAWKSQDEATAKKQFEVWKANTENALKLHEYSRDYYKDEMDRLKAGDDSALNEIRAKALALKDSSVVALANLKDRDGILKHADEVDKMNAKLQEALAKFPDMQARMEAIADLQKDSSYINATPEEKLKRLTRAGSPAVQAAEVRADAKRGDIEGSRGDLISAIDEAIETAKNSKTEVLGVGLAPTGVQGMAARMGEGLGISTPGTEDNPAPATAFKISLKTISDRAQKQLAGGRYSTKAAEDMQHALASLGAFTSPETAVSALNQLKKALGSGPQEHSREDLEYTAKVNGLTVDEVKKRLGIK